MYGAGNKNLTIYFAVSYLIKSVQLEYFYPRDARFLSFLTLNCCLKITPVMKGCSEVVILCI